MTIQITLLKILAHSQILLASTGDIDECLWPKYWVVYTAPPINSFAANSSLLLSSHMFESATEPSAVPAISLFPEVSPLCTHYYSKWKTFLLWETKLRSSWHSAPFTDIQHPLPPILLMPCPCVSWSAEIFLEYLVQHFSTGIFRQQSLFSCCLPTLAFVIAFI